ncbi:response regulator [Flavobacterium sp.]|uniref:response regulator n=1 Tax=Flavobacterium sp. TaxID=239 RepID=UPI003751ED37
MNKLENISIVVVDDHQMFLDGMISVLSSQENFTILFAEKSPVNALLKLKNLTPDIIITDISMPEMNGIEFIKIINNQYPKIKILAISMFDNLQKIEGIDGYLLKETDKDILVKAINEIVIIGKSYFLNEKKQTNTFDFKKSILTSREKEIVILIAQEKTTDEIAIKLSISKATIESHKKNIFLKLQVKNNIGLVKTAIYLGVVK